MNESTSVKKKILLVDDHSIVRTGVKSIIQQGLTDTFIAEAWDEESALKQLESNHFDLIISDLTFSQAQDPSYFIKKMLPAYKNTPVLILSMLQPDMFAKKYMDLGVRGYIHKEAPDFQIMDGIRHVLEKGYYKKNLSFAVLNVNAEGNPFDKLSKREMEVTKYLVKGETLKMIAYKMELQISTVSTFKTRILEKMEVDSTLELARLYEQFCPE